MAGRDERYRYQGYRGGGGSSVVLKVIIILLAVLLLAGLVFVVFFMGEYMEFTEDGPQFRPPWVHEESAPPVIPSDPVVVDDPVVVVTDPAAPAPVQPAVPIGINAVEVTPAQLAAGEAVQAVFGAGGGTLVVEMKDASGALAWQSRTELSAAMNVNPVTDVFGAVSSLASEGQVYLVARVQCFRDQALAHSAAGGLLDQSGELWQDDLGVAWASPVSQTAVDYLAALCRELADMGFDEIVLDASGFPDSGDVASLAQNDSRPADLTAPVAAFYNKVRETLAPTGVCLAIQTGEDVPRGSGSSSGITAALLAQYAQRVWLPAPQQADTDYPALLTSAGMDNAAARIAVRTESGWRTFQSQ